VTHARDQSGGPFVGAPTGYAHATRRLGGARRNVSKRIRLTFKGRALEAWVLNVSRGGMRLLLENPTAEGDEFEALVPLGDELEGEPVKRPVRVVWADRAADGTIAGVEFLDVRLSMRVPVERDLSLEFDDEGEPGSEGADPRPGSGGAEGPTEPAPPERQPAVDPPAGPPGPVGRSDSADPPHPADPSAQPGPSPTLGSAPDDGAGRGR
jgi:PilZ domain-containing protein